MKSVTLLALAAGASATGFSFKDYGSFSCPSNTDNQCTDKQRGGFTWDDLPTGGFSNYAGFSWKGWTCKDSFGKREAGRFAPRTGGKAISGVCGHDASSSPSFGCESGKDTDKFSIGEIHVKPEFGCDLEFHYDMPGGEKCKHRSSCSEKGSVVKNDQCGGATSVTIVYPSQTGKPKPTCSVEVPTISFSCGSASTTKPPKTTTTKTTTSAAEVTTTSSVEEVTTTSAAETTASETSPAETTPAESTTAVETTTSVEAETTSSAVETTAVETTTSAEAETTSSPAATTSVIFANSTTSVEAETTSSPSAESTTSEEVYTSTTEFLSTSTIFSTVVSTITSCAPTVTNCPAHSVHVTTVLVPVSTTICPVTETHTVKASTTSTSPAGPTETLPCPTVVPKCLNTWIFSTGCSDNTDASCYCPDEIFVKNVFSCMYSYGETDTVISEAVIFFQGICAPYIPGNPAIATGAETVTTYITVAPTSVPSAIYTTVVVDQTTVVPCTNTAGETIPSSSSTVVLSTTLTVPQVGFTTAPSGGVGVVPVTSYTPVATSPAETVPVTGITTAAPVSSGVATGTGFFTPSPTPSQVVVSGGDKITGFGLAGLAVMALVAAL